MGYVLRSRALVPGSALEEAKLLWALGPPAAPGPEPELVRVQAPLNHLK